MLCYSLTHRVRTPQSAFTASNHATTAAQCEKAPPYVPGIRTFVVTGYQTRSDLLYGVHRARNRAWLLAARSSQGHCSHSVHASAVGRMTGMRSCRLWKLFEASVVRIVTVCIGSLCSPSLQQSYSATQAVQVGTWRVLQRC